MAVTVENESSEKWGREGRWRKGESELVMFRR